MIKTKLQQSFYVEKGSFYSSAPKKEHSTLNELIYTLDETPDFHDPLSEVSLFLAQKIRKAIYQYNLESKWSSKLQNILIEEITPDFQKQFPQYRLGTSAIKKTWEKIIYFCQQIQSQKHAINQDGTLNLPFFIRENLKQSFLLEKGSDLSYQFTHKLAMKLGECMAIIDGEKPKIDHLTHLIWASQRNLLSSIDAAEKSPYHEFDKLDRLIIQMILEMIHQNPEIGQQELQYKVKEEIRSLYELPGFSSLDAMGCNIAALLAQKFCLHSKFHSYFRTEQKKAIQDFIHRHINLYQTSSQSPQLTDFVRRTLSLYSLATKLPKNLDKHEIKQAVHAIYPTNKEDRPPLDQMIYAFISAEIVLLKNKEYCYSIDYVTQNVINTYELTKQLPVIEGKDIDLLEMMLWKTISEQESLLEKLPYIIGQKIEEQIGKILIDQPLLNFKGTLQSVLQFFKKVKELGLCKKWDEVERKIYTWAIQGELSCRFFHYDNETPLMKEIIEKSKGTDFSENHEVFVSEVCQSYLRKHPTLTVCLPQLTAQIWILYKSLWYQKNSEQSPFAHFLLWHANDLTTLCPYLSKDDMIERLIEISERCLPMMPIDRSYCKSIVFSQEEKSQQNKRDA